MLGSAPHANLEREEGAFLGVGADVLRRHRETRRGHIERGEIGPTVRKRPSVVQAIVFVMPNSRGVNWLT
jgi:hypothetical protein